MAKSHVCWHLPYRFPSGAYAVIVSFPFVLACLSAACSQPSPASEPVTAGAGDGGGPGTTDAGFASGARTGSGSGGTGAGGGGGAGGRDARRACILPLGDSITQGNAGNLSYRYPLWEMITQAGYEVNFVGSLDSGHGGTPTYPNPAFDRDHEGHWGWRADEIRDELSGWLQGYTAGIVLMHLGSNDVFATQPNVDLIEELKQIIEILRSDNPHVAVLMAKLIPARDEDRTARIMNLNGRMDGVASELSTDTSPVTIVDQFSGFSVEEHLKDGAHPNQAGERKMAERWYEKLEPLLGDVAPCP